MFYHGSNLGDLKELKPSISNQGNFIYFSSKRENIIPYLANPFQVVLDKIYGKGKKQISYRMAKYKFTKEGKIVFQENWPNYLEEIYKGQTGYIYYFENIEGITKLNGIPDIYGLDKPIKVKEVEVIPDIYEEILRLKQQGLADIELYKDKDPTKKQRDDNMFLNIYKTADNPLIKEVLYMKIGAVQDYVNNKLV